jgi:cellulose synthase/poly-beta-1,6-N-acetylglucosamine synthase-like glycosyltransferase
MVAVILCLRGTDPFLTDCLKGVLNQDYPRYRTHIVIDAKTDPAWQMAINAVMTSSMPNADIQVLKTPHARCSLKCSSLLQAVNALDASVEVVAQLDADTIPHPTWLRELVAPFEDPRIGATTGNRWYMPDRATVGAMTRYFWNAAAIVLMYWLRIPWGGTLAIRRSLIQHSDLLNRWSRAFSEDTMIYSVLRQQGLALAFVPSLMMVNRESCSLSAFFPWVSRQLLCARLYHPGWYWVVAHGVVMTALPLGCFGLVGWGVTAKAWLPVTISGLTLVFFGALLAVLLGILEYSIRQIYRRRGEKRHWVTPRILLLSCMAIPILQLLYPLSLAFSWLSRYVGWRGVTYRIEGPWKIHLLRYRPYLPPGGSQQDTDSI